MLAAYAPKSTCAAEIFEENFYGNTMSFILALRQLGQDLGNMLAYSKCSSFRLIPRSCETPDTCQVADKFQYGRRDPRQIISLSIIQKREYIRLAS